jgi:predicted ATP-grasp superfamily ATP-dependent carboligase
MGSQPAVVLSGHIMALGVARSLGAAGIPVVLARYRDDDMAQASRFVTRSVRVPRPGDEEEAFIVALERLGPSVEGSPLLPASDETLLAVARHRERLGRWYRVAAPAAALVERIIMKEHTYALAEQIGVPAPRTVLVGSEADLERHRDAFPFPCLAKPSQSHRYQDLFGRKMVRVETIDELAAAYRQAAAAGLEIMLQELIPGDDRSGVNYNSYRVPGSPPVEFTAAKVRLTPRRFGPPSVVVSREIPEVVEPARRLLEALGFEGFSCTEFKRDQRDGVYKLMEVNGRFNLSSLLMLRSGLNFPLMAYRHLLSGEAPAPTAAAPGVYWIDGTKDVVYAVPELLRRPWGIPAFTQPYRRPHVFAVFDRHDPRPLAVRYRHLVGRGVAFVARRIRRPSPSAPPQG